MKKGLLVASALIFSITMGSVKAQNVGIGTTTPNANAILDITVPNPTTTPQGLLLPRLDSTSKYGMTLGTTDAGLVVFDTDLSRVDTWDGTQWDSKKSSGGGGGAGAFENNSGIISNSPDSYFANYFVFGAPSSDYTTGYSSRVFFDKTNSAFRAGDTGDPAWDSPQIGYCSAAFGKATIASGEKSFAVGELNLASGNNSFASGGESTASGNYSIAMGDNSTASADVSMAFGWRNTASGDYSFVTGNNSVADGEASIALGQGVLAKAYKSVAVGMYNVGGGDQVTDVMTDPIFEVGIGTSNTNRANALTILKNGNVGVGVSNPMVSMDINGGFAFHNQVFSTGNVVVPGNDTHYKAEGGGTIEVEKGITPGQIIIVEAMLDNSAIQTGVNITGGYTRIRLAAGETVTLIWDQSTNLWTVLATTGFYQ